MEKFWEDEAGWEKVVCWSTKAAIYLKRVKIEEKLLWRAYKKSPTLFRFFGRRHISTSGVASTATDSETAVFALFLPVHGTAQQSVLDGTNGLSSFKPCAYCRIVHRVDIVATAQLSCFMHEIRSSLKTGPARKNTTRVF